MTQLHQHSRDTASVTVTDVTVTHSDSDSDSDSHSCRTVKSRLKGCHLGVEVTDQEESVLVRHLENAGQRGSPPLLSSSLQP